METCGEVVAQYLDELRNRHGTRRRLGLTVPSNLLDPVSKPHSVFH